MKYSISIWHGESKTLYYLVACNPNDETDWEVVETYHNTYDAHYALEAFA